MNPRLSTLEGLPVLVRENLGTLDRRILEISDWIERDRREPDKVLLHVASLRSAVVRNAEARYVAP